MAMVLISGALYGAWTALEHYDNTRAAYREELERSRILNFTNQQRISELMQENARLQLIIDNVQLTIVEEIPVGNFNIDAQTDDELEENENVGYQVDTERTGSGSSGVSEAR